MFCREAKISPIQPSKKEEEIKEIPWTKFVDHENKGNDRFLKKLLIFNQILLIGIISTQHRTVWGICILMLDFKSWSSWSCSLSVHSARRVPISELSINRLENLTTSAGGTTIRAVLDSLDFPMYKVCTRGSFWTKSILGTSYYFFPRWGGGGREVEGLLSLLRSVGLLNINKEYRKLTVNWLPINCQWGGGGRGDHKRGKNKLTCDITMINPQTFRFRAPMLCHWATGNFLAS